MHKIILLFSTVSILNPFLKIPLHTNFTPIISNLRGSWSGNNTHKPRRKINMGFQFAPTCEIRRKNILS